MPSITELIKQELERTARYFEPNPAKRNYYRYLEERIADLYYAVYNEPLLMERLGKPDSKDIDIAIAIASHLSDFGRPCKLFDNHTFAITRDDTTDFNNVASIIRLKHKTRELLQEKAEQSALTPEDLRQVAAISYYLQSLRWSRSGIVPALHSPYRPRR